MAIMVQYKDNTLAPVPVGELDGLIENGRIVAFRRRDGWVEIGKARLRGMDSGQRYDGPERRNMAELKSCLRCEKLIDSRCVSSYCSSRSSLKKLYS